eukprot:TRINITY_DN12733_c0_g1_i1.p1 TRINITY_DN12733_c0_g1~~TRINITY_DN12733_c0_g1_i1.p1  ORF type:complete len:320 (+),score=39.40 TRINITY_DN12733_c0_g1_i1:127-1086(+)
MLTVRTFAYSLILHCKLVAGQRALHWVIRVSSLEETLNFTKDVLRMKVLRHEENDAACPLTCNGQFDTSWSKTMVGYGPEDTHYALELTYNYGIDRYDRGEGLQRFTLHLKDANAALARASSLGYAVEGGIIHGPDAYAYELLEDDSVEGSFADPFKSIVLRAQDPESLARWYYDILGMRHSAAPVSASEGTVVIGFGNLQSSMRFIIEPASAPRITQWEGRNAVALPEATVRAVNARVSNESPHLILHELRELQEKLGTLLIVILRDPAGYELCLVSSETFHPSVREATDYRGPDWNLRNEALMAITGGNSKDMRNEL